MAEKKILIATQNKGKLLEFESLLGDLGYEVLSPVAFDSVRDLEVEETGETFEDNSLLKAKAFAERTQLLTIADDSGLELYALEGFPGVRSDRWMTGTAQQKNQALLKKIENVDDRTARFVSCLCLFDPISGKEKFFRGEIEGEISYEEAGVGGFGYDPIFIPLGFDLTFAELGKDVKNEISHRKIALNKLKNYLK